MAYRDGRNYALVHTHPHRHVKPISGSHTHEHRHRSPDNHPQIHQHFPQNGQPPLVRREVADEAQSR